MSLIDTLDGIFMLGAYGWAYVKPIRKLYYNMNITFISVVIALFIGSIEGMQVIFSQLKLTGGFFDLINNLDFGNLGYIIIIAFLLSWIISIFIYKFKGYDHLDLL
jgi:high-affinity nickel-transport protein